VRCSLGVQGRMLSSFSYFWRERSSEEHKSFFDVAIDSLGFLAEHIEADSLGEGSALADSHDVTNGKSESGGLVAGNGVMSLFESVVLSDEMEVITTDDDVVLHFVGDNDTPINKQVRVSSIIIKISILLESRRALLQKSGATAL
jgi:hypothetical protein